MTQKLKDNRFAGLLSSLVLALTFAACGQSETGGDTSSSNAEVSSSAGNAGQDPAQVAAAGEAAQKAAQAAVDANVPGAIIATLNGETRTWYVANNLTEWDKLEGGGTYVDIIGQVDPGDFSWTEAMNLRFEVHGDGVDLRIASPSWIYYSEGATRHHSSSTETIVVSRTEFSGDALEVAGSFAGTVHFRAYDGDEAPRQGNPAQIQIEDGVFHARVKN